MCNKKDQAMGRQIDRQRIYSHAEKAVHPGVQNRLWLTEKAPYPVDIPFRIRKEVAKAQDDPCEQCLKDYPSPIVSQPCDGVDEKRGCEDMRQRQKPDIEGYLRIKHVLCAANWVYSP
jgi:hypothetical protein